MPQPPYNVSRRFAAPPVEVLAQPASLRQAETEVREKHKQLLELARANQDLKWTIMVLAHDLKEPLRTILQALRYLGRNQDLDSAREEEYLRAQQGVLRLHDFIGHLQAFVAAGGKVPRFQRTDSRQALQEALDNLHSLITLTGARVTHGHLPIVHADRHQLVQVFQNLAENSLKFRGGEAPSIHIQARQKGPVWEFSVQDNGIGLDFNEARRIFLPLQQAHPPGDYPGNGLGLAICRTVIARHGGDIWAETSSRPGATICFTLPVRGTVL